MLLETMSEDEVSKEVNSDFFILYERTIPRLGFEYDKERRKKKIFRDSKYLKTLTIKTHRKNVWRIIFSKSEESKSYRGLEDLDTIMYTYRYVKQGIQVFVKSSLNKNLLRVYTGHFLNRYNERMGLKIEGVLKIADHFFNNNSNTVCQEIEGEKEGSCMDLYKEGYAFSQFENNKTWLVSKTFIRKDMLRDDQEKMKQSLIDEVVNFFPEEFNGKFKKEFDRLIISE